jgi:hypothetical protein
MDNPPRQNSSEDDIAEPSYDGDVVAWANEQARLLRAGEFHRLDIEHIADEIEDVGRAERRELEKRLAILIAHVIKWHYQPTYRSGSWSRTIREQRRQSLRWLRQMPSLKPHLANPEWISGVWGDAVLAAMNDTGLDDFPEDCPWDLTAEILRDGWLPG